MSEQQEEVPIITVPPLNYTTVSTDVGSTVDNQESVVEESDSYVSISSSSEVSDEIEEEEENDGNASSINEEDKEEEEENDEEKEEQLKLQKLQSQQQEIRKKIMQIQKDSHLTEIEKAKKIQEIMTYTYKTKKHISTYDPKKVHVSLDKPLTEEDRKPTYNDEANKVLGCQHYQRGVKFQANCCGKWYTCRFCHDSTNNHEVDRKETKKMMCMYCGTIQKPAQDCSSCKRRLANYYCDKCKFWDDDVHKSIYHCDDCGICRIGKGLGKDYFHCKKCNVCMAISLKNNHKCIERNLESNCPICGEYMFTSTSIVIFMPCGHCIHYKCHQEYVQTNYQCPTCFKSLANMTEYFKRIDTMLQQHKMPPEYENWKSYILCNDCERKSYAKYHFLYHKCAHCNSYNTKVLKTYESDKDLPPSVSGNLNNNNINSNTTTSNNNEEDGSQKEVNNNNNASSSATISASSSSTTLNNTNNNSTTNLLDN